MAHQPTSAAQHSPGPWFFDPVDLVIYDGDEKTSEAIATVEQRQEPTEDSDETSHNGWVMAAGPELLEAAKLAVNVLTKHPGIYVEMKLRAAIAKAEGKAS